ncbi:hypothetical protein [Patulibacter minatonensis]|uniref:hypothetical protein n=1 Tax=Patulibacter minatonensis TaxID=298163 RepID=UPI00047AE028|nr:hypothetical protein [Patulibacter minatonensis]
MSDLQRRSGRNLSRSQKVDRAFKLTVATGGLGVGGIVLLFVSPGIGVVLLVLAAISGFMLKNTLGK